ncbi:stage II sporulation protein M [Deminuibacter soli]|uniref:Stage II sporulation protein M n=1 Tax=Deminuibacter soli TaxID=2291815 RepID=A0A3E1NMA8_9BACT|nr:stage II sporulation protein M [Deminuibacter soli]RFM28964.1 stage II sporulation protein M [Deminuibacter soli]
MREALFIRKNKDRWLQMEELPGQHPDETAQEFTELVEDLGFSKTFYPGSKITQYLNALASKRYLSIYENQKQSASRLKRFFMLDLPLIIAKHHRTLLISFLLFILFVAIGVFSAKNDSGFVRQVLGNDYVDMTERNIREGHPFGVYNSGNEFLSFLYLFANNFRVSLMVFSGGLLLGYFTITMLLQNAIMVGVFEYFFYTKGMVQASLLTIMIHGTLELSAIVISACAGLVLAKSWLFPGTIKRLDALKIGAKEGLAIALCSFPMLLMAAFFEGFVTRHTDMPLWLKLVIILLSLAMMAGYLVIYPLYLKKKINAAAFV